jgi:alanine dehydrogenase
VKIGIPKETPRYEHRVGLTPFGVSKLSSLGCEILVERDAGRESHFSDQDFTGAGALVVYDADEIWGRADLVCKVAPISEQEAHVLRPGATVCGFQHVSVMSAETLRALADRQATLLAYEAVENAHGTHPIRRALSEVAGQMVLPWAAYLLQHEQKGRGLVLGNVPGIAPSTVVILGAGALGWTAARRAIALGAHVIVLDDDLAQLRRAMDHGCENAVTAVTTERNLSRFIPIADVVIGAAAARRGRAPFLVSESMVRGMKPGSVILDLAIDEGGGVETSRPTTLQDPTFQEHGVTHFCVPNLTSNAPRTASRALALATISYLSRIAEAGLEGALRLDPGLARGVAMYRGKVVHDFAAQVMGTSPSPIADLLGA